MVWTLTEPCYNLSGNVSILRENETFLERIYKEQDRDMLKEYSNLPLDVENVNGKHPAFNSHDNR